MVQDRKPLPSDPYERARRVMLDHQQTRVGGGCYCGWNEPHASYARHVIDEMRRAGLQLTLIDDDAP